MRKLEMQMSTKKSWFFIGRILLVIVLVFGNIACSTTREISMNEEELFRFTLSQMDVSSVLLKNGKKIVFNVSDGKFVQGENDSTSFIVGYRAGKNQTEEVKIPLYQVQKVSGERVDGNVVGTLGLILGISVGSLVLLIYALSGVDFH